MCSAYFLVCSTVMVERRGTPSWFTMRIASTPLWLWRRFSVSSTSLAACAQQRDARAAARGVQCKPAGANAGSKRHTVRGATYSSRAPLANHASSPWQGAGRDSCGSTTHFGCFAPLGALCHRDLAPSLRAWLAATAMAPRERLRGSCAMLAPVSASRGARGLGGTAWGVITDRHITIYTRHGAASFASRTSSWVRQSATAQLRGASEGGARTQSRGQTNNAIHERALGA